MDNFKIRILNKDLFLDYRGACMITKGFKNDLSPEYCMNPSYKGCKIVDNTASCDCNHQDCPMNIFWTPKNWETYWFKQLTAMHSTIRSIHFTITDLVPKSVANQLVRHTAGHPQPYMQSSRPDWTGKERSNDPYELRWLKVLYTPESFLQMCAKRLCNKTEERTRKVVQSWVDNLKAIDLQNNDYDRLAEAALLKCMGVMAKPQCEIHGANKCVELKSCGKHEEYWQELINGTT